MGWEPFESEVALSKLLDETISKVNILKFDVSLKNIKKYLKIFKNYGVKNKIIV